ncbi:MAG: hypothetical protein V2G51_01085 [bacterium JZ-2024 1]
MVPRLIPSEVLSFAEKEDPQHPIWIVSRGTLQARISDLRRAGFHRVWFAVKACPLPELAREISASGAGLMMTFPRDVKRFAPHFLTTADWGFSTAGDNAIFSLKWVLQRFLPAWISVGDLASLRFVWDSLDAKSHSFSFLLLRVSPPSYVRTACGYYGFKIPELPLVINRDLTDGLHFHIGTNKSSANSYLSSLSYLRECYEATGAGLTPLVVNIGGGFSSCFAKFSRIAHEATRFFPRAQIWVEPGRYLAQRALFWVTRGTASGTDLITLGELPVSVEARRCPLRYTGALLRPSGLWSAFSAEAVAQNHLRIISASIPEDSGKRESMLLIFYDCAAYATLPDAPVVIV